MKDYERDNALLTEAIRFAAQRHAGQLRKGSTRPYILHPLEVLTLLSSMGADNTLQMAGVLHDTLEDTDTTREELEERFGPETAALVAAHSEDKSRSWQERKEQAIREAEEAPRPLKLLILADKLSNLRSALRDYRAVGEQLWERFNAPREKQAWYYAEMERALSDLKDDPAAGGLYAELQACRRDLYGL